VWLIFDVRQIMVAIAKEDWNRVHELAAGIVNASEHDDAALESSNVEELRRVLIELEAKYGACSRITATRADYADENDREALYQMALQQARAEGDTENERLVLESLSELADKR
jgi:multidrug resistance efflux pump